MLTNYFKKKLFLYKCLMFKKFSAFLRNFNGLRFCLYPVLTSNLAPTQKKKNNNKSS